MGKHLKTALRWFGRLVDEPGEAAGALLIVSFVIAVVGYVYLYGWGSPIQLASDFYANAATEFFSIAITVLVIDRLYARRSANEEKQRILRQLASPSNEFALEAARLCTEKGWLTDGSLKGAQLAFANLKDAFLQDAHLEGAQLSNANLEDAQLYFAHLEDAMLFSAKLKGAFLSDTHLEGAYMIMANLEDAYLFDAYLEGAKLSGATCNNRTDWPKGFDYKAAGVENVDEAKGDGEGLKD